MQTNRIFFTADTHFGDESIIRYENRCALSRKMQNFNTQNTKNALKRLIYKVF